MTDLDERLGSALERLAAERAPGPATDVLAPVHARVRRRHRARLGATFALPLLLIGLVAWTAWPTEDGETPVVTDPDPVPTTLPAAVDEEATDTVPGTQILDPGPLSVRMGASIVELDDGRILVWGGSTNTQFGFERDVRLNDGAVYDPVREEWTMIARAPVLDAAGALLADDEVIALGDTAVVAWEPRSDSWRTVVDDLPGQPVTAVWTGAELVVATRSLGTSSLRWLSIDPESGAVQEIPAPPVAVDAEPIWTGSEVIVLGKPADVSHPALIEGAAYSPATGVWRRLATSPDFVQAIDTSWTGERVLVVDYSLESYSYDPVTDSWSDAPAVPGASGEDIPPVITGGGRTVVLSSGLNVRRATGDWFPASPGALSGISDDRPMIASDGLMWRFGRNAWEEQPMTNGFEVTDIDELVASGSIHLGVRIDLPEEASLISADVSNPGSPAPVTVAVIEFGPDDCEIEVRAGVDLVSGGGGTVTIDPVHGEPPWEAWIVGGDALGYRYHRIDCGSLERSIELARYFRPNEYWYPE